MILSHIEQYDKVLLLLKLIDVYETQIHKNTNDE